MSIKRNIMIEEKRNIIQALLEEYDIKSAEDIQDSLGLTIQSIIKVELEIDDPQDRIGKVYKKNNIQCYENL